MTTTKHGETQQTGFDKNNYLDNILEEHQKNSDSLIPVLIDIQAKIGYIPPEVQRTTAKNLGIPLSRVSSVVSFYSYFSLRPKGKHIIGLCMGTACYSKGAQKLLESIKHKLNIEEGETSEDNLFTLSIRRCLGTCAKAPVMMVDDKIYGNLTPEGVNGVLEEYTD